MDAKREPLIEFKGVSKTFGDRNILNRIDLSVYEGEVTTLIGLSGTGKSVTLKHIIGMLKPDEGQDYVGHEIWELDSNVENDDQSGEFADFSVPAGLAQGKPQIEIESVMEFARFNQKELARFRCARGGKAQ